MEGYYDNPKSPDNNEDGLDSIPWLPGSLGAIFHGLWILLFRWPHRHGKMCYVTRIAQSEHNVSPIATVEGLQIRMKHL